MIFELINPQFWKYHVYSECNHTTLLNLIKTSKYFYNIRKQLYLYIFPQVIYSVSSRIGTDNHIYYNTLPLIRHSVFSQSVYVIVHNETIRKYFMKYNFDIRSSRILYTYQQSFKTYFINTEHSVDKLKSKEYINKFIDHLGRVLCNP